MTTETTSTDMAEWYAGQRKELRDEILRATDEAKAILDRSQKEKRDLTDAEKTRVDDLLLKADGLNARMENMTARSKKAGAADPETKAAFRGIAADLGNVVSGKTYTPQGRAARGKVWADAVLRANSDGHRYKGVTPTGTVLVDVPAPEPFSMGHPVTQVRTLIPTEPCNGVFAYTRQDLRTNNAAPVAHGAKKPTSVYEHTRIQKSVSTVAHLTSPIHRQDLMDSNILQQLISGDLLWGLESALEEQLIDGDGVGPNILGMLRTPGILTATRAGDDGYSLIVALRSAITKIEMQGLVPTGMILNPLDHEALETSTLTSGSLAFAEGSGQSLPLDRSARRAWGVPIVSSIGCPQGTAVVADFANATRLYSREEANITWTENMFSNDMFGTGISGNLFEGNMIVFRAEGRWGFGVGIPAAIVKVDLTPVTTP